MNAKDTLLIHMVTKDLQSKSITDYQLKDEIVSNPKQIKVGANEMIYTYYILIKSAWNFKTVLKSSTQNIVYDARNMFSTGGYQSNLITAHLSTVHIQQLGVAIPSLLFISYIRVIFNNYKQT